MYFRNYVLRKTWLNKSLKSPLSEDPSGNNMLRGTKYFWNLSSTTVTIFFKNCEGN